MKNLFQSVGLIGCFVIAQHLSAQSPEDPKTGFPYDPYPNKVTATEVNHFGNLCWKVAAGGGTWYFENGKTGGKSGFSSAFDMVGNDWIGNDADKGYNKSPKGSGKHEYRGWPNFGNGNFDHPQRASGTKTKWVDEQGNEVEFKDKLEGEHLIMRSYNSKYEVDYHFFTTHLAIKVITAKDKYAFLFEGPIGGEQEGTDVDKWFTQDGKANQKLCSTTKCASPYIYYVDSDPKDTQILYMATKNLTSGIGGESYVQSGNMVVVSYGRVGNYPNDKRSLTGTDAVCVFGFHEKADHKVIDEFIMARLADPYTASDADKTPPTAPSNVTTKVNADGTVKVSWNAATDVGKGVDHYTLYRGDKKIGTTESTDFTDSAVQAGVPYIYSVSATDKAGLEGEKAKADAITSIKQAQLTPNTFQIRVTNGSEGHLIFVEPSISVPHHVEISDINGRLLHTWDATGPEPKQVLSRGTTGLLILQVTTHTERYRQKILIVD